MNNSSNPYFRDQGMIIAMKNLENELCKWLLTILVLLMIVSLSLLSLQRAKKFELGIPLIKMAHDHSDNKESMLLTLLNNRGFMIDDIQLYNNPHIKLTATKLIIAAEQNRESGVYIRYRINKACQYNLIIYGQNQSSQSSLRIRRDNAEPEYYQLDSGLYRQPLAVASRMIELLIYNTTKNAYELDYVYLYPLSPC